MRTRLAIVAALLLAVITTPMVLRPRKNALEKEADARLVIVTPHNQTIRRAFAQAFADHMQKTRGMKVYLDWRVPGGTSEVRRLMDSEFDAAAKHGRDGIGIDLFFGGGAYDFNKQARKGQFSPSRIFQDHPDWFSPEIIPATHTGEQYYHPRGLWIGVCLSSFGIVYNRDRCAALGIAPPPSHWDDLTDPRLIGQIAVADPTKSGSVNKAFEMLVQEERQKALATVPRKHPGRKRLIEAAKSEGWKKGLQRIQKIGANARYFTDSSAKIPLDVAQGNAAAGLCIDFYGRTYNERHRQANGESRVVYLTPVGGSSVSVDPVAILKGAPHRALAEDFIAFLFSKNGQRLWNLKPGEPGAPLHALRRLPIRRDLYTPEELKAFSDPDALPYERTGNFSYRAELTAPAFSALALIIRSMCLDSHHELQVAWQALIDHNFPPQATAAFEDVAIVGYENAMNNIRTTLKSRNRIEATELQKNLVQSFRENYRRAANLARSGL